jgi:hypothetical protein
MRDDAPSVQFEVSWRSYHTICKANASRITLRFFVKSFLTTSLSLCYTKNTKMRKAKALAPSVGNAVRFHSRSNSKNARRKRGHALLLRFFAFRPQQAFLK